VGFRVCQKGVPRTTEGGSAYKQMGFRVFPQGVPRTPNRKQEKTRDS